MSRYLILCDFNSIKHLCAAAQILAAMSIVLTFLNYSTPIYLIILKRWISTNGWSNVSAVNVIILYCIEVHDRQWLNASLLQTIIHISRPVHKLWLVWNFWLNYTWEAGADGKSRLSNKEVKNTMIFGFSFTLVILNFSLPYLFTCDVIAECHSWHLPHASSTLI